MLPPAKGIAAVRTEFIRQKEEKPTPPPQPPPPTADAPAADASDGPPPPKRMRGMNKQRDHYRPEAGVRLCAAILAGRDCTYGASCRFSHDLAAAFAARPADLGERCPIYTLHGHCRFGVNCRFGSEHLAPGGVNVSRDGAAVPAVDVERNAISNEVQAALRKNKYDFSRANAVWKAVAAAHPPGQQQQQQHAQPPRPKGGGVCYAWRKGECRRSAAECRFAHEEAGSAPPPEPATPAETAPADSAPADPAAAAAAAEPAAAAPAGDGAAAAPADGSDAAFVAAASARAEAEAAAATAPPPARERRTVDFRGKLYLAPLTTVGNLPYRRVCKEFGADITCSEMAMATNLLQGQASEWALLRRHPSEDIFGVQIAGGHPEPMGRAAQLIDETLEVDFVDINMGCPIDAVCNKGCGAALAQKSGRVQGIVRTMSEVLSCPLTVKVRTGYAMDTPTAHKLLPHLKAWGAAAVTLHGRSRQQRYSKAADWSYIGRCAAEHASVPLIGNGDAFSYEDVDAALAGDSPITAVMLSRGALIKPWVFTEIKERRHWDISAAERLEYLRRWVRYGLEHWGTDARGVATTRNFLLEWLSFLYRYVPVGLLERLPARIQERPPPFVGRSDLETLMASAAATDWVKITEMLLGPVPDGFAFTPKHVANAYARDAGAAGANAAREAKVADWG